MDTATQTVVTFVVLAVIAWAVFIQVHARRQVNIQTHMSPHAAEQAVIGSFGGMWRQVRGRGYLNFTPKLRRLPPTLSVDIVPNGFGCEVQIWTSEWTSKFGIMNHAMLMWRKKRRLATLLSASHATGDDRRPF